MQGALKRLLAPLLLAQAWRVRARTPVLPEAAGAREGRTGAGPALRLLILGDSSAAGVGLATQERALAGRLAQALAREMATCVHWRLLARSGLDSAAALALLREAAPGPADLAVVVLGVNDVLGQVPVARALGTRAAIAEALRADCGVRRVVFAPLPPLGRFGLLPQPLRAVLGAEARRHDAALARWAATHPEVRVARVDYALGPGAFAADGFHPGEAACAACAEALARCAALSLADRSAAPARPRSSS